MKANLFLSVLFLGAIASANTATYFTSCQLKLAGSSGALKMNASSAPYEIPNITKSSSARVDFDIFTLVADVALMAENAESVIQPTVEMQLLKGHNPVQGNITYISARGWDFEAWPIGKSQSLSSYNFLDTEVSGTKYSRLDYSCSVTRIR